MIRLLFLIVITGFSTESFAKAYSCEDVKGNGTAFVLSGFDQPYLQIRVRDLRAGGSVSTMFRSLLGDEVSRADILLTLEAKKCRFDPIGEKAQLLTCGAEALKGDILISKCGVTESENPAWTYYECSLPKDVGMPHILRFKPQSDLFFISSLIPNESTAKENVHPFNFQLVWLDAPSPSPIQGVIHYSYWEKDTECFTSDGFKY